MENRLILVPQLGVNDKSARIVSWICGNRTVVATGQEVAIVETTKVTLGIEADAPGYLVHLAEVDSEIAVGGVIGAIVQDDSQIQVIQNQYKYERATPLELVEPNATKKAVDLAESLDIDLSQIQVAGIVREKDIQEYYDSNLAVTNRLSADQLAIDDVSRALVIYGCGKGGAAAKECAELVGDKQVIAFLDDNQQGPNTCSEVPVLSGNQLEHLAKNGLNYCFVAIAQWKVRLSILKRCSDLGITVINLIHPNSYISPSVTMGQGNYLNSGAHVEAYSTIGNGCIIGNGVIIPHHNVISDGCHIAPGVSLGSSITIGRGCVIGIGASISTEVNIGAEAIVGVGSAVGTDVPAKSLVQGVPAKVVGARN